MDAQNRSRQLPPLTALVAFEAAARHLSFTRAARELHVTQAAISHQVRALEEALGLKMFRRLSRALVLTDEGRLYLQVLREGLDHIDAATRRLRENGVAQTLIVSVLPSFATRWLVPRLGRFRARYPHIDVRVDASTELVDFSRSDVDIAIRCGRGGYPGLHSDLLTNNELFPVCSPALLDGPVPLREPADLRHHVLLHDQSYEEWPTWLRAAGVDGVEPYRGPSFADASMLLQAAVAGQGVGLARSVLAAEELKAGRLVRLFSLALPTTWSYYIVCPEGRVDLPKIKVFREWLLAEAD